MSTTYKLSPDQLILRKVSIEEWKKLRSGPVELAAASYGARLKHVALNVQERTGLKYDRCEKSAHRAYNIVVHGHENSHYPFSDV